MFVFKKGKNFNVTHINIYGLRSSQTIFEWEEISTLYTSIIRRYSVAVCIKAN